MVKRDAGTEPSVIPLARSAAAQARAALAADDLDAALAWLERAHRLVPKDPNIMLSLASTCLGRDPARAAGLFTAVADQFEVRQAWIGLAAARLRMNQLAAAQIPLSRALSRHALVPDIVSLADQLCCFPGGPGWCGLSSDGEVTVHPPQPAKIEIRLGGKAVRGARLPPSWSTGHQVEVLIGGEPAVGSPIQIRTIRRTVGCVEAHEGGIRGWAWHPGDPDVPVALTLVYPATGRTQSIAATVETVDVADTGPLARPRLFGLARHQLIDPTGLIHIRGPDDLDLLGSPLCPTAELAGQREAALLLGRLHPAQPASSGKAPPVRDGSGQMSHALASYGTVLRADAPVPDRPVGMQTRRRAASVVIPVHDGAAVTSACLASVLAAVSAATRVVVVDDGSTDGDLIALLDQLARRGRISLLRHARALGFAASANAGIMAANGRDVVLLNSDTLVPAAPPAPGVARGRGALSPGALSPGTMSPGTMSLGARSLGALSLGALSPGTMSLGAQPARRRNWLERLRDAAYGAPDIGTVTPLSNDAAVLSYPGDPGTNPRPDQAATDRMDQLVHQANRDEVVDIPVGVGFCLYLRRDCLNAVGLLRADIFAQGYGEENDFCLRARRLGWRNVALTGLFVGHHSGTSFGTQANHLRARNGRILERLHPGHDALVARFTEEDPLAGARRRIDLLRWRRGGRRGQRAAILVTHNAGGGVERRLTEAVHAHAAAGRRPIVLRPAVCGQRDLAIAVHDGIANDMPNLVYRMPDELPRLLQLLRAARPDRAEVHHLLDHPQQAVHDLITRLDIPYDVHIHDYAWFCPRVTLVGAHDRYCGEPELADCEACVADLGHFLNEDISVAALRSRSAAFLAGARRVVTPSDDTAGRVRRHFPGLLPTTIPHEDDAAIPRPGAQRQVETGANGAAGRLRVCVVGGLGVHKGYDIVLACARDAVRRNLQLEFVVVGNTIDDERLLATGRIFVTGGYQSEEAVALIVAQRARLGFIPSIWPETWCLSLGDIWRAGLSAAAFDIGAPAERIRRTGRGFLLPLGLSAGAINNALIAAAGI